MQSEPMEEALLFHFVQTENVHYWTLDVHELHGLNAMQEKKMNHQCCSVNSKPMQQCKIDNALIILTYFNNC